MARVKGAMHTRKHRSKVLKLAKGYWGNKHRHFKMANEQMMKSGRYAYIGRKQKKRDYRKLWITRISAACKMNGLNYSTFMHGLKLAGVDMNRKMLSEMAIHDPAAFAALCNYAKEGKVPAAKVTAPKAEKVEKAEKAEKPAAEKKPAAKKAAAPKAEKAEKPAAEKKPATKKAAAPKAEKAEKPAAEKKPAAKKAAAPKAEKEEA